MPLVLPERSDGKEHRLSPAFPTERSGVGNDMRKPLAQLPLRKSNSANRQSVLTQMFGVYLFLYLPILIVFSISLVGYPKIALTLPSFVVMVNVSPSIRY